MWLRPRMPIRTCSNTSLTRADILNHLTLPKYNCESQSKTCVLPPEELRGVPVWQYTLITFTIFLSAPPILPTLTLSVP